MPLTVALVLEIIRNQTRSLAYTIAVRPNTTPVEQILARGTYYAVV